MDIIVMRPELLLQLDAIVAAELDGGSLRLFQNDFVPTADSILADFSIATFTGYASQTIAAWGASFLDELGIATSLGGLRTFTQTADTVNNIVYGAYYLNAGGALSWAARFPAPINFDGARVFNMVPKYQHGQLPAA